MTLFPPIVCTVPAAAVNSAPSTLQHFHVWVFVAVGYQHTANSGFQNPALHQTADPLGQRGANNWDFVRVLVFA